MLVWFFAEKKQILIMVGQSEMFKKLKAKEGITFFWNNFKRYIILQSFPYRNKYFRSQMTKNIKKKQKQVALTFLDFFLFFLECSNSITYFTSFSSL